VNGDPDLMITLPGVPESVSVARRSLRSLLQAFAPEEVRRDAGRIVEELAKAALRHGGESFTLSVQVRTFHRWLRVEVHDAGRTTATPVAELTATATGTDDGAGLRLVRELSSGMGHELDASGTTLWAEMRWRIQ
jgi:hypothetical protein